METAMKALADKFEFRIRWEPFFLLPDTPLEGTPKPPVDLQNPGIQHLIKAGQEVGIDFTFKASAIPNTRKAHALMEFAIHKGGESLQNDVAERLSDTYFTKGKVLDEDVLIGVGKEAGLDPGEVKAYLNNDKVIQDILTRASAWRQKGVTTTPFFYMNGHPMSSNEHEGTAFEKMVLMAAEKTP